MLDVHDYCPDCGELRTSWPLEGAKLRARIAELEANNDELRLTLERMLGALDKPVLRESDFGEVPHE